MSARTVNSQLLAAVTVTILLGACGPGASPAGPSQSPSALEVATDAAAAVPERTYVSGTMGCDAVKETPIEGVERPVRLTFDCPFEMSDPRVTGSQPMDCDEGFYDLADLPGGVGIWDTCSGVLTGQGGSWKLVSAYGSEFMKSGVLRVSGAQIYEGQGVRRAALRGPVLREPRAGKPLLGWLPRRRLDRARGVT